MTAHDRFLELASTAIDERLGDRDQQLLERHLETCPACRREAAGLRSDAAAIAGLPRPRLDAVQADWILERALVHTRPLPTMRLVFIAALLALLALGVAVVGAELLHITPPPLVIAPSPPVARSTPGPSASAMPATWTVSLPAEAGTSLDTPPVAVAASGGQIVAVGGPGCTASGDGGVVGCWAHVRRSTDGVAWTPVTTGDLAVGKLIPTSGTGPGMRDIAGGPNGFVAIGYAGDTRLDVAIWISADGSSWTRARLGSVFARGRVKAVTATAHGWVIVGSEFLPAGPRGAAWTSRDGRTWVRAADGPAFDIGGYYNSLDEQGAGGFRDVVADGEVVVAVGDTCDGGGRACRAAAWRSADGGATWARSSGPDVAGNLGVVVRSSTSFVAFGQRCESDIACVSIVASSDDGLAWTSTALTVLPADGQIRAAAAVAGGIVAAGSGPNSVVVIATRDTKTWDLIHEESFQPTGGASAPPGYATIDELGLAVAANGAVVMAGTVRVADDNVPWRAFVAIVEAGQP